MESSVRLSIWLIVISSLALSACTGLGGQSETPSTEPGVSQAYVPEPGLSDKARFREALLLLERGQPLPARAELQLYLQSQPSSKVARDLVRQIDLAPSDYFPADYREVVLPSGVSLSSLSKQYLGSVFKFHALAKYNGFLKPGDLTAGQDIKVPLTARAKTVFEAEDAAAAGLATGADTGNVHESTAVENNSPEGEEELASEIESEAVEEVGAAVEEAAPPALTAREIDKLHRTALGAYRAQDLDKAIALWDEVLRANPEHESARLYRTQAADLQSKLRKLN